MHSFVGSKDNPVWIWLAMDIETRRIIAVHFGNRELEDAQAFIAKIPKDYLSNAVIDTDGLAAYEKPLFEGRYEHCQWVGKGHGMTTYIERFNGTARCKLKRINRKTYGFSKDRWIHERMFMSMVHRYNDNDAPRIVLEHAQRRRWNQRYQERLQSAA